MNTAEYLKTYAAELAERIEQTFEPMHARGDRSDVLRPLKREPKGGQVDAILAMAKTMDAGQKTVNLIGVMGTGKTFVSMAAIHQHAAGAPYRTIVMCPPHLCEKWVREIIATIPKARPRIIERYRDLTRLAEIRALPIAPEYFVVSESMAKLGSSWEPAFVSRRREGILRCPVCHSPIRRKGDDEEFEYLDEHDLSKRRHACTAEIDDPVRGVRVCGEPLWRWTHQYDRWPVASYVAKKMRGLFDYAILDECHEMSGSDSAIAIAMSKLVQSVRHVLPLTGTYMNGYAHSIMHLLWRSSPETLVTLGFGYGQETEFARRYGRLEKTIKSKTQAASNRESRGSAGRTQVKVLPGIMPTLVGDHMLNKSVFLSLEDVAGTLPPLEEEVVGVDMDAEQQSAYAELEGCMGTAIELALREKNMTLLTQLVQALMGYTDFPNGYGRLGYYGPFGQWETVCDPPNLDPSVVRPKEQALVDQIVAEANQNRQCWVFCEMTQKRDVQPRLESLFKRQGLKVKILKSQTVSTKKRDAWIATNAPGVDVIISHPGLVETGMDLFDKGGSYNFPTLAFYQTGLMLSTLRQASRRSYRIGQGELCRVLYLYYKGTMQQRCMDLMSAKLQAAEAMDGKFSTEGLASLSDAGEPMGIALAKSLLESIRQQERGLMALVR